MKRATLARCTAAAAASVLALGALGAVPALAAAEAPGFARTATYPVFLNVPAGVDPAAETVAEISAASPDGKTVIYTDALGKRVGFLDVTDPGAPVGLGTVSLAELGHEDDQPTSVSIVGDHVLVVIDETGDAFTAPDGSARRAAALRPRAGRLDRPRRPARLDRHLARTASTPRSPSRTSATRTSRSTGSRGRPAAGPRRIRAGRQLTPSKPSNWKARPVAFDTRGRPSILAAAGLYGATDPEPEYVAITPRTSSRSPCRRTTASRSSTCPRGKLEAGVLGRNRDGRRLRHEGRPGHRPDRLTRSTCRASPTLSAGSTPDLVATANEGDWNGGTRGWSIFDAETGDVVWDAGNTFEQLAIAHGVYNDGRADKKGPEPEGLAIAEFGGTPYAFVASERSNFVAVYDLSDPAAPSSCRPSSRRTAPRASCRSPRATCSSSRARRTRRRPAYVRPSTSMHSASDVASPPGIGQRPDRR